MNQRREQACNFYREVFPLPLFKTTWVSKDYNRILKKMWNKKGGFGCQLFSSLLTAVRPRLVTLQLLLKNPSDRFDPGTDFAFSYKVQGSDEWALLVSVQLFFLTDSTPNADLLFDVTPKTLPQLLHFKTTTTTRWTKNRASSSNCRRGLRKFCLCCGWHALTGAVGPLLPCH